MMRPRPTTAARPKASETRVPRVRGAGAPPSDEGPKRWRSPSRLNHRYRMRRAGANGTARTTRSRVSYLESDVRMNRSLATGSRIPRPTSSSERRNSSGSDEIGPRPCLLMRTPPGRPSAGIIGVCPDGGNAATWGGRSVGRADGQSHLERGAPPGGALHPDRAAVDGHDLANEEEPDAGAGVRLGRARVDHEELLEDPVVELRRDADAVIAHAQDDGVGVAAQVHVHVPSGSGELDRVLHEVEDQALQEPLVAGQHGHVGRDRAGELESLHRGLLPLALQDLAHD